MKVSTFGPYCLDRRTYKLLKRVPGEPDQPVALRPKAFDVLQLLIENAGRTISQDEFLTELWPETYVQPDVLKGHVFAVRTALEDRDFPPRYIETVRGRGYRFIADVEIGKAGGTPVSAEISDPSVYERSLALDQLAAFKVSDPLVLSDLPLPLANLIGRSAVLDVLERQLMMSRLLTIVGPAGIGKSRVALASVARLAKDGSCSAYFVDLAPLTDSSLIPSAIALALRLPTAGDDALGDLIARLRGWHVVLILDNCEHLIGAVAETAEAILLACGGVKIVATSREALRVGGETVYQIATLDVPGDADAVTADEAIRSSAVQLFVERARSASGQFELTDENAAIICSICRQLDGLPLAIELAAGSAIALGLHDLSQALGERLSMLSGGARNSERHRTLQAALDWSYALLSGEECFTLATFSVFTGSFTLEAATAVLESEDSHATPPIEIIRQLAAKSLVSSDHSQAQSNFRLLETTRLYAAQKLAETGQAPAVQRRYAMYLERSLESAEAEWVERPLSEWWELYGKRLDDVRAALASALPPGGDSQLGVLLTAVSGPLWMSPQAPRIAELKAGLHNFRGLERDTFVSVSPNLIDNNDIHRLAAEAGDWCSAEYLRGIAEFNLDRKGLMFSNKAEALFDRSMTLARQQGALTWELRTAHSWARLKSRRGSRAAGLAILQPVLSRYSEGFETADVRQALSWIGGGE